MLSAEDAFGDGEGVAYVGAGEVLVAAPVATHGGAAFVFEAALGLVQVDGVAQQGGEGFAEGCAHGGDVGGVGGGLGVGDVLDEGDLGFVEGLVLALGDDAGVAVGAVVLVFGALLGVPGPVVPVVLGEGVD